MSKTEEKPVAAVEEVKDAEDSDSSSDEEEIPTLENAAAGSAAQTEGTAFNCTLNFPKSYHVLLILPRRIVQLTSASPRARRRPARLSSSSTPSRLRV